MEMSILNDYEDNYLRNGTLTETPLGTNHMRTHSQGVGFNDHGPHREMAIDCPVSFVGMKKEPPRYPRPLSVIQNSGGNTPRGKNLSYTLPKSEARTSAIASDVDYGTKESMERIKRYQEDLAKRREVEDRRHKEQEFLRTSLRGSKKLQDLEERKVRTLTSTGFDNPTYLAEEEEFVLTKNAENIATGSAKPKSIVVDNVVSAIEEAQQHLQYNEIQQDLGFVNQFMLSEQFQRVLRIHDRIVEASLNSLSSAPCSLPSQPELIDSLNNKSNVAAARELSYLLTKPHVKNLLMAYDDCVQLRPGTVSSSSTLIEPDRICEEYLSDCASQFGEDSIKIVRIQKTAEPLGATVRNEGEMIIIGRVVKGGIADKSGLLHEGDEILEINGTDVRGKSINEVSDLMSCMSGMLTFLIHPCAEPKFLPPQQPIVHVRANFSYDPEDDSYIPCRELGMSFVKGDVLHILNQDDPNWWQAYREGEDDQLLAGLIPSQSFHELRESLKQAIINSSKQNSKKKHRCNCAQKRNKKNRQLNENETAEILSYEEVTLYYPQPNRKRPIVLVGPPNVGRQEIRQRLMENQPDRFAAAVPHTSRPKKEAETDGQEYHFVQRNVFERDIMLDKFVEYGEYEKHFFGTSMEAIRKVVNSGKICILNFHPQALKLLKASDLKPYFVFIAPPNIEKLKQLRQKQCVKVTDDELKIIIEKARKMEEEYGHFFDMIIVNQNLDRAYEELLTEINRLELEEQWVPVQWMT